MLRDGAALAQMKETGTPAGRKTLAAFGGAQPKFVFVLVRTSLFRLPFACCLGHAVHRSSPVLRYIHLLA